MNNIQDTEIENKPLILAGIRDNLLKPMTEEICSKTEKQIKHLRALLMWIGAIAVFSVIVNVTTLAIILFSK